jgi:hypothetical protein
MSRQNVATVPLDHEGIGVFSRLLASSRDLSVKSPQGRLPKARCDIVLLQ